MATFLCKYKGLMMGHPSGKGVIKFENGEYSTDDKQEIQHIKASQLFGVAITEVSNDLKTIKKSQGQG